MIQTIELLNATGETLYTVGISGLLSSLLGLWLGSILFAWEQPMLTPHPTGYRILSFMLNALRAIPFIILMIALIPITRLIVGSAIGIHAATFTLTIGAIPLMAQAVHTALKALPKELLLQGQALGATSTQILKKILLPEAMPIIIRNTTLMWVTLVGYAAMAGALDGGGLGDFAIRYGYQRFDTSVMLITVILIYFLVQAIQSIGYAWAKHLERPRSKQG